MRTSTKALIAALSTLCIVAGTVRCEENVKPRICFVGVWDRAMPLIANAAEKFNVETLYYRSDKADALDGYKSDPAVIFLLNMSPIEAVELRRKIGVLTSENQKLKVIPLDTRGVHAEFDKAGLLTKDKNIPKYWRPNGAININRMFAYTLKTYFGSSTSVEPPVLVPDFGFYEPGCEDPFSDFNACRAYKVQHQRWKEGAPVAAILIQQSFWITRDTKVTDAEVRELEKNGVNAVVLFGDTQVRIAALLRQVKPDLIVEDRHGGMWENRSLLEELDVPYLRPISMLGYTIEQWLKDPRGLAVHDVGMFMTVQESWGTIEPVVVGGLKANISGFKLHEPFMSGVERFAKRAAAWTRLRAKPNSQKRIALIYYNKGLGRDDLMRGSPTGAFLNGPESAVRFLPRLKERGYDVEPLPKSADELIGWMQKSGRNIGPWAQGELDAMVKAGDPALVPLEQYQKWFAEKLSPENQRRVIEKYGPPPGRMMVVEREGKKFIVIPRIKLGNLILTPQPERGEKQDEKLLHSRDLPPPHNYLAFYWWLEDVYKADAIIHWGTHGSLELLPGKEAGMTRDCWSDICAGNIPIINLWITDNLGEATLSRRRSYAHLVDHMPPPALSAGLSDEYNALHDDLDKFVTLEEGILRQEYRKRITAAVRHEKLDKELKLKDEGPLLSDNAIDQVLTHIHMLYEARTPLSLHVLGVPPSDKALAPYLAAILGRKFEDRLAAFYPSAASLRPEDRHVFLNRKAVEVADAVLLKGKPFAQMTPEIAKDFEFGKDMLARLRQADNEIVGLLRALEGRYVEPGPGPEPIRNPSSAPGGRNLYALNPEEIPTRAAWDVGVQLINEMLKKKKPKKVGIDLNGMETMRDFGVMEAQILYLLGTRPVWDRNNLAIDVELIPREELKRPRVDVFIAMGGMYKENFPSRVKLLDKAVRLAAGAKEEDNLVRLGTQSMLERLKRSGMSDEQAAQLAPARIFGTKPGNMSGTNILYLIPRSGVWDKDDEVADVYIDNMSYVFTKGVWGQKIDGLYKEAIQGTDLLVRVWASNMTSQLSNHHAYEYLGGLSLAVKKMTGRDVEAVIADVRDPNGARMRDFQEVLTTTMKAELLNRKWIEGMKEQGYAGAGHAAELVKNTFGWSVTRKGSVSDEIWNKIVSTYIDDSQNLGLRDWFEKNNPHALQEIAATMLEASRKGYWHASPEALRKISATFARLAVAHGDSAGLVTGGNKKLEEFAAQILNAPGDVALSDLAAKMSAAMKASAQPQAAPGAVVRPASSPMPERAPENTVAKPIEDKHAKPTETKPARATAVSGFELKSETSSNMAEPTAWIVPIMAAFGILLVLFGFIRKKGSL